MNRAEFEKRLLEDPAFRDALGEVEMLANELQELREAWVIGQELLQRRVFQLGLEGVPLSSLARLIGVTPQRVNAIVRDLEKRLRPGGEEETNLMGRYLRDLVRMNAAKGGEDPDLTERLAFGRTTEDALREGLDR